MTATKLKSGPRPLLEREWRVEAWAPEACCLSKCPWPTLDRGFKLELCKLPLAICLPDTFVDVQRFKDIHEVAKVTGFHT